MEIKLSFKTEIKASRTVFQTVLSNFCFLVLCASLQKNNCVKSQVVNLHRGSFVSQTLARKRQKKTALK